MSFAVVEKVARKLLGLDMSEKLNVKKPDGIEYRLHIARHIVHVLGHRHRYHLLRIAVVVVVVAAAVVRLPAKKSGQLVAKLPLIAAAVGNHLFHHHGRHLGHRLYRLDIVLAVAVVTLFDKCS